MSDLVERAAVLYALDISYDDFWSNEAREAINQAAAAIRALPAVPPPAAEGVEG